MSLSKKRLQFDDRECSSCIGNKSNFTFNFHWHAAFNDLMWEEKTCFCSIILRVTHFFKRFFQDYCLGLHKSVLETRLTLVHSCMTNALPDNNILMCLNWMMQIAFFKAHEEKKWCSWFWCAVASLHLTRRGCCWLNLQWKLEVKKSLV